MAFNFKEKAQEAAVLFEIMKGKEKITTDEIIAQYAGGFKVDDFDMVDYDATDAKGNTTHTHYVVVVNDKHYYAGGIILTKAFDGIVEEFEGNIEAARAEYAKCKDDDKVVFVATDAKTSNGKNNLTKIDFI